jgi:hypothetical protein
MESNENIEQKQNDEIIPLEDNDYKFGDNYTGIWNQFHGIKLDFFRHIFQLPDYPDTRRLASINKWIQAYEVIEAETLCRVMEQYRNYFQREKADFFEWFQAMRFLLCVQAGMSRFEAYLDAMHHLQRVQDFQQNPNDKKLKQTLMNACASFTNRKYVLVLAQALDAPIQISYQGYKHQMIEVLRDIAVNGTSQRERVNAANSLLQHLQPSELSQIQININHKKEKTFIEQTKEALKLLAQKKLELMKEGSNSNEIINADIIEESKRVEEQSKIADNQQKGQNDD